MRIRTEHLGLLLSELDVVLTQDGRTAVYDRAKQYAWVAHEETDDFLRERLNINRPVEAKLLIAIMALHDDVEPGDDFGEWVSVERDYQISADAKTWDDQLDTKGAA